MTTFQIIMVVLGSLFGLSAFSGQIKSLAAKGVDKVKEVKPKPKPVEPESPELDHATLVDIVRCWENLKRMCEDQNLGKASAELDKIFPLLVLESEEKPNEV